MHPLAGRWLPRWRFYKNTPDVSGPHPTNHPRGKRFTHDWERAMASLRPATWAALFCIDSRWLRSCLIKGYSSESASICLVMLVSWTGSQIFPRGKGILSYLAQHTPIILRSSKCKVCTPVALPSRTLQASNDWMSLDWQVSEHLFWENTLSNYYMGNTVLYIFCLSLSFCLCCFRILLQLLKLCSLLCKLSFLPDDLCS